MERCFNWRKFRELFGYNKHQFTGVDYIEYYKSLVEDCGKECEVIFSNNPKTILEYTKRTCLWYTYKIQNKENIKNGAVKVFSLMIY